MKTETERTSVEDLFFKTKEYINTQIELLKLKTIRMGSAVLSSTLVFLVLGCVFSMVFLFLSIGLALYLGKIAGAVYIGFFVVAGLYVILGVAFYLFRKTILHKPISDWVIKNFIDD